MFQQDNNIYNSQYDCINHNISMGNKLFCTFSRIEQLEGLISSLPQTYSILYNKIFILYIKETDEYAVTYNIENGNTNSIPINTISLHRNKLSNTLYSINSLNELIKLLNNGILDINYKVNWDDYRNSILITQQGQFKKLNTKIHKIVEL